MDLNLTAMLWGAVPVLLITGGVFIGLANDEKDNTRKADIYGYGGMLIMLLAAVAFILALGLTF